MLWECLTGTRPFKGMMPVQVMHQMIARQRRQEDWLPFPRRCPRRVASLIRRCWRAEKTQRVTAEEVRPAAALCPGLGTPSGCFSDLTRHTSIFGFRRNEHRFHVLLPLALQIVKTATLLRHELSGTELADPVPLDPDEESLLPRTHSHAALRAADASSSAKLPAKASPPRAAPPAAPAAAAGDASWDFDAPERRPSSGLGLRPSTSARPRRSREGGSGVVRPLRARLSSGSAALPSPPTSARGAAAPRTALQTAQSASPSSTTAGRSYASWGSELPVAPLAGGDFRMPSFLCGTATSPPPSPPSGTTPRSPAPVLSLIHI